MSENCDTPQKRKESSASDENTLLGSFYRLKSYKKLEKNRKKVGYREFNLCENDTEINYDKVNIYTTPVRSSRRINNTQDEKNNSSKSLLECSSKNKDNVVVFTPNPYINEDVVDELLNDMLIKYKDRIQIINIKQPQIKIDIDEISALEKELSSKLCIDSCENDDCSNEIVKQRDKTFNDNEQGDNSNTEEELKKDNNKPISSANTERREYFISRNKPRVVIGKENQSYLQKDYEVIAENEYWMVIEFQKNSYLRKKHNCSRILTKKKTAEKQCNFKQYNSFEDSIKEYKVLHSELKQLLELSNYCYSPAI
ncbi:hypothetical protein FG386_001339 [Cryptosporidium ryanae]|uniref:uncharacterized protein n=1 Tax=Cryptosporidium ryanae TaxID=515981 RepID=UPI00351A9A01|nr:hypothetical protein FG386_001339 [Cryptosporidium ryanae]